MTGTSDDAVAVPVRVPGSKSITNRTLVLAAMARGTSRLRDPLRSDDTVAFAAALRAMGYGVREGQSGSYVDGGGVGADIAAGGEDVRVWCADAGTAARFLPPLAALLPGRYTFDGSDQLRARPVGPLVAALTALGVAVEPADARALPFTVCGSPGLAGGDVDIESTRSSQFASGLLMAGPLLRDGLRLRVGAHVSRPYLDMTVALMRRFGADVAPTGDDVYQVAPTGYVATNIAVEPDASTASYFFAAAAVTGRAVTVDGLGSASLQGDVRFVQVLAAMGARVEQTATRTTVTGTGPLRGGVFDMNDISDTFMTLACVAPYASGPVEVTGIGHARLKESDRIEAVAANLRRCGVRVEVGADWLRVHPSTPTAATIDCHRDHRIAMSFSVLALRTPGIVLDDPACVSKTFPEFHEALADLCARWGVRSSGPDRT